MRVTTEKLPGVTSATVSLNEGRVAIALDPDNTVTMRQIRQGVERNGFTPRDATINARADVAIDGEKIQLRITGTTEKYDIAATPHGDEMQALLRAHAGQTVVIDGVVPPPTDPDATAVMQVNRVEPMPCR